MTVLLDENFPLGLVRALEADGLEVEHIITLGWRGASDNRIRTRLAESDVVFLTQDDDFLFGEPVSSVVVVSRVRQACSERAAGLAVTPLTPSLLISSY